MTQALESLKNFHFNGVLLSKLYNAWAKKVHWINLPWNWSGIQNLQRNRFVISNWHTEFYKFGPEHSWISKTFNLIGSFWTKYIMFELKKYMQIIFHETEEGYKIWPEIDLSVQIDIGNFTNFDLSTAKSLKLSF